MSIGDKERVEVRLVAHALSYNESGVLTTKIPKPTITLTNETHPCTPVLLEVLTKISASALGGLTSDRHGFCVCLSLEYTKCIHKGSEALDIKTTVLLRPKECDAEHNVCPPNQITQEAQVLIREVQRQIYGILFPKDTSALQAPP